MTVFQLGTERFGSWARVAQLGRGRAGMQTQVESESWATTASQYPLKMLPTYSPFCLVRRLAPFSRKKWALRGKSLVHVWP